MPTYDYKCTSCDHEFEKFQSITAEPIKECPECGDHTVQKMVSGGMGVIFKGSGFYSTDYKNKPQPSSAPSGCGASQCGSGGCGLNN